MPETGEPPYDWQRASEIMAANRQPPKTAAQIALEKAAQVQKAALDKKAQEELERLTVTRMVNAVARRLEEMLRSLHGLRLKDGGSLYIRLEPADGTEKNWATAHVFVRSTKQQVALIWFQAHRHKTFGRDEVGLKELPDRHDARYCNLSPEEATKRVTEVLAHHLLVDQPEPEPDDGVGQRPIDV